MSLLATVAEVVEQRTDGEVAVLEREGSAAFSAEERGALITLLRRATDVLVAQTGGRSVAAVRRAGCHLGAPEVVVVAGGDA
ncbi:hypothetical protein [Conexibacter woesei]|uniref:hypothetical protein n=1 Tax=Conexibacter woesei TaxID=191495 RepID=UPI0012DCD0CF|nr:hypothetical protein [Conexibacter woesei]